MGSDGAGWNNILSPEYTRVRNALLYNQPHSTHAPLFLVIGWLFVYLVVIVAIMIGVSMSKWSDDPRLTTEQALKAHASQCVVDWTQGPIAEAELVWGNLTVSTIIYPAFHAWQEKHGRWKISKAVLRWALQRHGVGSYRVATGLCFSGIRMRSPKPVDQATDDDKRIITAPQHT